MSDIKLFFDENCGPTGLQTVSAAEFGVRIAKAFYESKSSTALFFIQQAFTDCEDDNGIHWELFNKLLTRITTDDQSKPETTNAEEPQGNEARKYS